MIGKTISHYQILEKLGEGGMGEVYLAEDTKLDRRVALKFLPTQLASDEELRARFKREAQAAAALNHPNIITIHEVAEYETRPFIAMEYVEGEPLKNLIGKKELSIGEVLDVALQVSDGLAVAHQAGIVHRDIKPQNILMGKDGRVRICDFGLAKAKRDVTLTQEGSTLGTIAYMSPEQAQGTEADHRSDIFSFGVVLYEMVTGQLPFKGEHEAAVINSIVNDTPEPLARYKSDVPEKLEGIIGKAMEKNLDLRYQHVDDVGVDLRRLKTELETGVTKTLESAKKPTPSVAVLPFTNLSADKEQEYFCDGMAEEIINALTHVEDLRVVARTSAFSFRGKEIDIRDIGKKLSVGTVLEGSVRKAGNRLRITAQLVNVADGYHLWSEKYDRNMEDVFAIQDEISLAIVDKLKVKLLGAEKADLMKHHTENKEAYTNYLKGLYFWNRRSEVGFNKALEYFQKAIEIDPLYALPYVGIADTFNIMGHFCFIHPGEAFSKAKTAVKKALEIDDRLGEAHASLAWIHVCSDWDWLSAEREYKRAVELNSNYATAHEWYALFLAGMERFDEAIAEVKQALELDPLSVMINAIVGVIFYFSRQYDEAIKYHRKAIEIDPNFVFAYIWQGLAYWEKGMNNEALVSLQKAVAVANDMTYALGHLGMIYALADQRDEAIKIIDQLSELSIKRYVSPLHIALVYVGLDEKDKVFEYFEKAYLEREPYLFYLKMSSIYDSLRSDPRFTALLKKMGLEK